MAAAGAFCGVPYIVIMVVAVQRIGTAAATVAVIFGQLAMSLLIDNFGWLGNDAITFSPGRLGAIVCLGLALFFIYRFRHGGKSRREAIDRPPVQVSCRASPTAAILFVTM